MKKLLLLILILSSCSIAPKVQVKHHYFRPTVEQILQLKKSKLANLNSEIRTEIEVLKNDYKN